MLISEEFQTPLNICSYMVDMIQEGAHYLFEPTPGMRNLTNTALERGYAVESAADFFLSDKTKRYDAVIMNPPFSCKSAYLEHAPKDVDFKGMKIGYHILTECMERSDNVIALMPWFVLSDSDVRMRTLKAWGMKSLTPLPRKTFNYARIQTVVIELQKGYKGETLFKTDHF